MQNVCLQGTVVYIVKETSEQRAVEVYMHERGVIIHLKLQENSVTCIRRVTISVTTNLSIEKKYQRIISLLPSPLDCGFFCLFVFNLP